MGASSTSVGDVEEVDVLIIGAGPSGLMAAQALARQGVRTKIIDKRSGLVLLYQAFEVTKRCPPVGRKARCMGIRMDSSHGHWRYSEVMGWMQSCYRKECRWSDWYRDSISSVRLELIA